MGLTTFGNRSGVGHCLSCPAGQQVLRTQPCRPKSLCQAMAIFERQCPSTAVARARNASLYRQVELSRACHDRDRNFRGHVLGDDRRSATSVRALGDGYARKRVSLSKVAGQALRVAHARSRSSMFPQSLIRAFDSPCKSYNQATSS